MFAELSYFQIDTVIFMADCLQTEELLLLPLFRSTESVTKGTARTSTHLLATMALMHGGQWVTLRSRWVTLRK